MCLQCLAEAVSYGEVIPGLWVSRAIKTVDHWSKDQVGLVFMNDPSFIFESEPKVMPDEEEQFDAWTKWCDYTEGIFMDALGFSDITSIVLLIEACKKAGWNQDEHGRLDFWLMEKVGKILEKKN